MPPSTTLPPEEGSRARVVAKLLTTHRPAPLLETLTAALDDACEPALVLKATPGAAPSIVWANRAFSGLTGYEPDALQGETLRLFRGPDTSREAWTQLQDAWASQEAFQIELTHYRKNGRPYVAVVDLAPLHNEAGEITHWLSFHHDVTARRRHEKALRYEATHDTLTGLPNRAALREHLQALLHDPSRTHAALLYLDLDRFKLVNDSLGHSKGDRLLVQIADILRDTIRDVDTAARIGGDEFAVCLSEIDAPEDAHAVARQIYDTLNEPIQLGERTVFTPASIGIVVGVSDYDTVEEVLRDADTAMYESKDDLSRPFVVYEQAMTQKADAQLSLDAELRQGLERSEFEPFFQPILTLADGSLYGCEVLARWHHPTRGLLAPDAFLDAAEATGLIVPIGHQVIEKACEIAGALKDRRGQNLTLSLTANFSRQEFFRAETHTLLSGIFDEYDLHPGDFTMEISERTVANISEEDVTAFLALKKLGVDITLDDFGTGFSSLQSLRRLPVDGLKIDKDLLGDANGQRWDRDLIDLIVQMGHTLDQTVTAEGIERESQLRALRSMGCSYGQGFLFARPVPASEVEPLLDATPWSRFWTP